MFRLHNLALFEQMYPLRKDRSKLIAAAKQGRQQLQAQMAQEREEREQGEQERLAGSHGVPDKTSATQKA